MARKYARDNRGRFASKGAGATARGGRLKTAGGNKRETQTMQAKGDRRTGTIVGSRKPRGTAATQKTPKLQFDDAANSRRLARATARIDKAFDEQNTFMVDKLAKVRASYMTVQTVAKGNSGRAKEMYRSAPRFATISNPRKGAKSSRQTRSKGKTLPHSEAMSRRTEAMLKRGEQIGLRAQNYLRDKGALQAPIGSRLSSAEGRAGRVAWANRNRLAQIRMQRVNTARKERRGGFS